MYTIFNFIGCEIHSFYDLFDNGERNLLGILIRSSQKKTTSSCMICSGIRINFSISSDDLISKIQFQIVHIMCNCILTCHAI